MFGKCLETRSRRGLRWRRYAGPGGRVTTYEIPEEVLRGCAAWKNIALRLEKWNRAQERKAVTEQVKRMLAEGIKPEAVAHETGRHVGNVRKWRKKIGNP